MQISKVANPDPENTALQPTMERQEYDPYKRPPNIEIAKKHGEATKYGENRITQGEIEKCPCCGCPVIVDRLELCCSRKDFFYNGPGIALYFDFILFCICILSIYGIVAGLFTIIENKRGNRCAFETLHPSNQQCNDTFYNMFALSNRTDQNDLVGSILNFITTILILFASLYYTKMIKKLASDIDQSIVTVADYSIMVSNLPFDVSGQYLQLQPEQDIHNFFNINPKVPNGITELKKICLGYDIAPYVVIQEQLQAKQDEYTDMVEKDDTKEESKIALEKLKTEMQDLQGKLDVMEKDTSIFNFSGVCFITYNTQTQSEDIREFYRATQFQIMFRRLLSIFNLDQHRTFHGKLIAVDRAPEPGDILWENLGVSLWSQLGKKIITSVASSIVLSLCFAIILAVEYGQQVETKLTGYNKDLQNQIRITVLGFSCSLLISVINVVLAVVIRKFAAYEKHKTQTEFNISVAKKLGLAQFLNTAILTLIIHLIVSDTEEFLPQLWRKGGLNQDINIILMTNAVFSWLSSILDPFYFYALYQRSQIKKQGDKCPLTQKQANIIFEGTEVDLAQKYAQVAKTILLTFFYAYLLPIGIVYAILSLIFQFWVEKVILLRRDKKPTSVSDELAEEMVDFYIEIVMMMFSVGCLTWQSYIFGHVQAITIAQFAIALLFYILPMEDILKPCLSLEWSETSETFEQTKHMFWDDYDRRNPLTMEKALSEWVSSGDAKDQKQKQLINHFRQQNQNVHNFGGLMNARFNQPFNFGQPNQNSNQIVPGNYNQQPQTSSLSQQNRSQIPFNQIQNGQQNQQLNSQNPYQNISLDQRNQQQNGQQNQQQMPQNQQNQQNYQNPQYQQNYQNQQNQQNPNGQQFQQNQNQYQNVQQNQYQNGQQNQQQMSPNQYQNGPFNQQNQYQNQPANQNINLGSNNQNMNVSPNNYQNPNQYPNQNQYNNNQGNNYGGQRGNY